MRLQPSAFFDPVARRLRFLPWRRGVQLAWQTVVTLGLMSLCLLILAWLTLQWGILPHIEDWRPTIERHASRAVGVPVRIGHIAVRSSGWVPALDLRDVVLRDPSGAEALRLPRVSAALSPRSLLVLAPRLSQLYVEDARLLVRRDADGHLHVGGLDLAAQRTVASSDESATLDWIFSQQELVLRHGVVRWVDEQRHAPALELTDVDLVVRNGLRAHALRIDATPPPEWGDRTSVRALASQPLFAHAGDWRRWSGTLYADLPRGDVAQLRRHVDLPFELDGGQGALRLWLDFQRAQWRSATADVRLRDVGLRLADDLEPLAIARAGGRLVAQRDPDGVVLAARHFGFETASGVAWPEGDLRVAWQQRQPGMATRFGGRRRREAGATGPSPARASGPVSASTATVGAALAAAGNAPLLPWDAEAPVTGGELSAERLDLALMRRLAAALPLPADARRWLADYQPEGLVTDLAVRWTGAPAAPATYRANAAIVGLSIAAGAVPQGAATGRPGWRNASLNFDASETGGIGHAALDGGAVELPGVFEDAVIPFDRFGATVAWTVGSAHGAAQPAPIDVTLRDVHFANADVEGDLQLQWRTGGGAAVAAASPGSGAGAGVASAAAVGASRPGFGRGERLPGLIDLHGRLARVAAARLARYLPLGVGESTRDYLGAAFHSGEMTAVKFDVRGDLAGFPYARQHDGDFRIAGHVAGVDLDYVPGDVQPDGRRAPSPWPAFTQVQGDLVLDRGTLEIRDASARMGGLQLHDVHGGIRALYDKPALALQGGVGGPMPEFLRYVAQSPVGGWLHDGLAAATASGDADLDIALAIPLRHPDATTVAGTLTLPGNDLRLLPGTAPLADARAHIAFTERGMTLSGGSARVLGGEAIIDGGTQPDDSLRFDVRGTATADGLRRISDDPTLARLAGSLSGQSTYRLQVGVVRGQTEFALTSPLTGVALGLPAPLNKPADANWPLRVAATVGFDAQGHPHDTLRADLARGATPLLQAEVQRDLSGSSPRPLRAAYAVGAPLPAPQPGGILLLQGPAFDADAWWSFLRTLSVAAPGSPGAAPATGPAATDGAFAGGYGLTAAELKTADLRFGGRHLANVDIQVARVVANGEEVWRSNIASDQTHGVIEYRPETPARGAQLFARLDRLSLDAHDPEPDAVASSGSSANAPASTNSVPALDVVVDNLELNGKKLGKLEVGASLPAGTREWRLARLALTTPEASFTGTGRWTGAPQRHMALDFKLALADSGAFLGRLGMGEVLKRGKGELAGAVTWTGSPLAIDYPSLQGELKIALDAGQFLKADAGAARLLGVLSLQSLPRRLTLDFRDIFQEGFAFDNVTGDVQIDKGVASTKDLRMRGLNAAVLMIGSADLKVETQDLDVIVVPEINAGAASLAYAAINPVIGIGTFLAQLFLRDPLTEAGTREFHVVGSWSDPKVEPVEHKAAVAAAALAASQARAAQAAAAASAPLPTP